MIVKKGQADAVPKIKITPEMLNLGVRLLARAGNHESFPEVDRLLVDEILVAAFELAGFQAESSFADET